MPPTDGREREIKLELGSAEDRDRLLAVLPPPSEVKEQSNHYYDLPRGDLRAAGVMLRLRIEKTEHAGVGGTADDAGVGSRERARITVKEGAKRDGAGLFDSAETEADVLVADARRVAQGDVTFESLGGEILTSLAARFGDLKSLACWGTLENRRSVHPLDAEFVLEVDRAVYPDGTVLNEVELESDDPKGAHARLTALLDSVPVSYRPSTASKSERLAAMG